MSVCVFEGFAQELRGRLCAETVFSDVVCVRSAATLSLCTGANQSTSFAASSSGSLHSETDLRASATLGERWQSPVFSIPPEILGRIFVFTMPNIVADSCMDKTGADLVGLDAGKLRLSKPWRPVFLVAVCRYWRDVGLNLPRLWSLIDIRGAPGYTYNPSTHGKLWTYDRDSLFASECNMRFARHSLQLSGNVPLDIVVWAPAEDDVPQLCALLAPHSERFRAFHLYAYQPGSKLVDAISQWFMPQLQQYTLWASCGFSILNSGVFGAHTPAITELTLSNIPYWLGDACGGLRRLFLIRTGHNLTCAQFLHFLAASPRLEELILHNSGPTRDLGDDVQYPGHVDLPRLTTISIHGSSPRFTERIMKHVKPAASLSLSISIPLSEELPSILEAVSRLEGFKDMKRLRLDIPYNPALRGILHSTLVGSSSSYTVTIEDYRRWTLASGASQSLAEFFASCSIEEFWVGEGVPYWKGGPWQDVLEALSSATKIVFCPCQRFAELASFGGTPQVVSATPFPSLITAVSWDGPGEEALIELERFLEQRVVDGLPISQLVVASDAQISRRKGTHLGPPTSVVPGQQTRLERVRRLVGDLRFEEVAEKNLGPELVRHVLPCQAWTLGQCYQT